MLTCPFAVCPSVWHKWKQRIGENKVGDDDRQSRAFIFSKRKSGCMMEMMVVGFKRIFSKKGKGAEEGEEMAERNADSGNAIEHCYGNGWVWGHIQTKRT